MVGAAAVCARESKQTETHLHDGGVLHELQGTAEAAASRAAPASDCIGEENEKEEENRKLASGCIGDAIQQAHTSRLLLRSFMGRTGGRGERGEGAAGIAEDNDGGGGGGGSARLEVEALLRGLDAEGGEGGGEGGAGGGGEGGGGEGGGGGARGWGGGDVRAVMQAMVREGRQRQEELMASKKAAAAAQQAAALERFLGCVRACSCACVCMFLCVGVLYAMYVAPASPSSSLSLPLVLSPCPPLCLSHTPSLAHRRECNELLRHAHKELEAARVQGQTSLDEAASAIALNMTLLGQVCVRESECVGGGGVNLEEAGREQFSCHEKFSSPYRADARAHTRSQVS